MQIQILRQMYIYETNLIITLNGAYYRRDRSDKHGNHTHGPTRQQKRISIADAIIMDRDTFSNTHVSSGTN